MSFPSALCWYKDKGASRRNLFIVYYKVFANDKNFRRMRYPCAKLSEADEVQNYGNTA